MLFCGLTEEQRALYRAYLASSDVSDILAGTRNALAGLDILRKVCVGGGFGRAVGRPRRVVRGHTRPPTR